MFKIFVGTSAGPSLRRTPLLDPPPPSPATIFILSALSCESFRGILVLFEGQDPTMCTFGLLGCRVMPRCRAQNQRQFLCCSLFFSFVFLLVSFLFFFHFSFFVCFSVYSLFFDTQKSWNSISLRFFTFYFEKINCVARLGRYPFEVSFPPRRPPRRPPWRHFGDTLETPRRGGKLKSERVSRGSGLKGG